MSKYQAEMEHKFREYKKVQNDYFMNEVSDEELLSHTTQPFWQSMRLSRKRLQSKGLTVSSEYKMDRRQIYWHTDEEVENGRIPFVIKDNKREVEGTAMYEVTTNRIYYKDGKQIKRGKSSELLTANFLKCHVKNGKATCPNCGYEDEVKSFIDGCDACGTKFEVHDFETKVSGFSIEENTPKRAIGLATRIAAILFAITILCTLVGYFSLNALIGLLLRGQDSGSEVFASLMGFLAAIDIVKIIFKCSGILFFIYIVVFVVILAFFSLRIIGEEKATAIHSEFSVVDFFQNLECKFRSIHLTDKPNDVKSFLRDNLEENVLQYRDIVDCDMVRLKIEEAVHINDEYVIKGKARNRLTRLKGNKIKTAYEDVEFTAMCNEDVVDEKMTSIRHFSCKNCGSSINILEGSVCEYCDSEFDYARYGWVITKYSAKRNLISHFGWIRIVMIAIYLLIFGIGISSLFEKDSDSFVQLYEENKSQVAMMEDMFADVPLPDEVWSESTQVYFNDKGNEYDYVYEMDVTDTTKEEYIDYLVSKDYFNYSYSPDSAGFFKEYIYEETGERVYLVVQIKLRESGAYVMSKVCIEEDLTDTCNSWDFVKSDVALETIDGTEN